jgi:hypothetical protein
MGNDGASGMYDMKRADSSTIPMKVDHLSARFSPEFHLLSHRLQISLHAIEAIRNAVDK